MNLNTDKKSRLGISPQTLVQNNANKYALDLHTKIEQDQLPKPSRNLDVMLSATNKKIKNAVQRLNTAINKHSAYIDLDHNF